MLGLGSVLGFRIGLQKGLDLWSELGLRSVLELALGLHLHLFSNVLVSKICT